MGVQGVIAHEHDDEKIADCYMQDMTVKQIAEHIDVSPQAVQTRIRRMQNGHIIPRRRPWSADDVTALINAASEGISSERIARKIGRSTTAVRRKRMRLGIKTRPLWTADELLALQLQAASGVSDEAIADYLSRTAAAVISKRNKMHAIRNERTA